MRLRNVKNAREILESSPYFISKPTKYKGNYKELFGNDFPIHVEIGTGKGQFLILMAKTYPNINFIGVEMKESILVRAIQKVSDKNISNLKFIVWDAFVLDKVFDYEISTIYLNFSDPWPKKKHHKRRLTSPLFLDVYDKLFLTTPTIIQKTDNTPLFISSIINLCNHDYKIEEYSLDLEKEEKIFNIATEYEEKFMKNGVKINYLKAIKK